MRPGQPNPTRPKWPRMSTRWSPRRCESYSYSFFTQFCACCRNSAFRSRSRVPGADERKHGGRAKRRCFAGRSLSCDLILSKNLVRPSRFVECLVIASCVSACLSAEKESVDNVNMCPEYECHPHSLPGGLHVYQIINAHPLSIWTLQGR